MAVDASRLKRLAREPTRVFAFSEVTAYRWPLVRVEADGDEWWGPGHGPWLFRQLDEEDTVLARAVDKLGFTRTNSTHSTHIEGQLAAEGEAVTLPEPLMVQLDDKHIVIGYAFDVGVLPAVPVAYTERRYGAGQWERLFGLPVFRYRTEGGLSTALVCCLNRKVVPDGPGADVERS